MPAVSKQLIRDGVELIEEPFLAKATVLAAASCIRSDLLRDSMYFLDKVCGQLLIVASRSVEGDGGEGGAKRVRVLVSYPYSLA